MSRRRPSVNEYCQAQGYCAIDTIPKAINALCFISHDPNAVLKDADPLAWELLPDPPAPPPPEPIDPSDLPNEISKIQSALATIPADDYQKHWIEIGMALYHNLGLGGVPNFRWQYISLIVESTIALKRLQDTAQFL